MGTEHIIARHRKAMHICGTGGWQGRRTRQHGLALGLRVYTQARRRNSSIMEATATGQGREDF